LPSAQSSDVRALLTTLALPVAGTIVKPAGRTH
jgi:hypothetical protein